MRTESKSGVVCRKDVGIIALVAIVALSVRIWSVGSAPLHPDELHYAFDFMIPEETSLRGSFRCLDCAMLTEGRTAHPMLAPFLMRWLWFLPFGWMVEWTPAFLRGFNVLVGALLVFPAFLVGRAIAGVRGGLLAMLLVALGPGLVWISRTIYLDPVYTLLIALWILSGICATRGGCFGKPAVQGILFGLILSTKISAPILGPAFIAGLLMSQGSRMRNLLKGLLASGVVWFALCDPAMYIQAILQPTDARYSDTWEREGASGVMNLLFVSFRYYASCILWDTPLTTFILAPIGVVMMWRRDFRLALFLLIALICLIPLGILHHPRLSGSHGFMPIYLVLALLAATAALLPKRLLMPLVSIHLLLAGASIALRPSIQLPFTPWNFSVMQVDDRYEMVRDILHRRDRRETLVFAGGSDHIWSWTNTLRLGQLSEGAIVLAERREGFDEGVDIWKWGSVVMLHDSARGQVADVPADFEVDVRFEDMGYTRYRRVSGQAANRLHISDTIMTGDGRRRLILPGGLILVSGSWFLQDQLIQHPSGKSPVLAGPPILSDDLFDTQTLEIHPPDRRDVIWGF